MCPGKRRALDGSQLRELLADQIQTINARIRAKAEHPFRVIKQQFGFAKVHYKGFAKNTGQIVTLFALTNLWMLVKS